ncbi:MAG: hypothetical protein REI94_10035 [Moraxellaceae bacterium]|nr:hypothetical protein [Moraxellaceae bacterium]
MAAQSSRRTPKSPSPTAPVLQLLQFPAPPANASARHVAEVLADHREQALRGDKEGAIVITIDKDGHWSATVAGSLIGQKQRLCSIAGGLLGNFSGM